jgi:hypothetical protein
MQRPEEVLQRALVQHLRLRLEPPWMFWANTNQRGTRKAWEQQILVSLGLKAGIPDLFVLGPDRLLIGIECKAPATKLKSGAKSKAKPRFTASQEEVLPQLAALGVPTIVARDIDDAIAALSSLGAKFRGRVR